ncbi:MAG: ABC transporter ATP-binding protein [Chloroflexi bacterium]|nr:ABC transporter ATP-binding protein [Chloroflexota bacterium]
MSQTLVIQVESLSRTFRRVQAVVDLTFQVSQGEIFGLLGPNGAGKTTTLRMLACLLRPTAGHAWVNGCQIGVHDAQIRHQVGILPEAPGLYGKLTAYENLNVHARLHKVAKAAEQIEFHLRLVGLWDRRDEFVDRFSRGMRQKVAIARALLHDPQVLLLDEPTAALDPQAARTIREYLLELRRQGRTILLCTHNLDEAERLCDRVGILRTRLLALDTPERLRDRLFGPQTILHLRNADASLVENIARLDFVHHVSLEDDRITVTLDSPAQQNYRLIEHVIAGGGQLTYVTRSAHTLEEAYLRLVQGQGAVP